MTSPSGKIFRVRFYLPNWFSIDVGADTKRSAILQAQALLAGHGADPNEGFVFDISRGGNGGWVAYEVDP